MTASKQAKEYGARSLIWVHRQTDLSLDRLHYMHKEFPKAFYYLIKGIVYDEEFQQIKQLLHKEIDSW